MQLDLNIKQLVLHQEAGQDWGDAKSPKALLDNCQLNQKTSYKCPSDSFSHILDQKGDCRHISFAIDGGHWPLDKEGVQKNEDNR